MRSTMKGRATERGSATMEYALMAGLIGMALIGPAEGLARRLSVNAQTITATLGPPEVQFAPDDDGDCEPFQWCGGPAS